MVALQQKEIEEEEQKKESRCWKESKPEEEKEKQKELREEEVRMMRTWSEEKSQRYVERFRGYRGDRRCKKCRWFRYMAHHYRRIEIKAERELKGGLCENGWEPLRCRVIVCEEKRMCYECKDLRGLAGMKPLP